MFGFKNLLERSLADDRGATAVEYGLIAALVVLAMLVALQGLGNQSTGSLNSTNTKYENANKGVP